MRVESVEESFAYLEDLYKRPIVPPEVAALNRIGYLLDRLGNPEREFKSIHITGTCGKGSTATMTARILEAAGYRVGLFRSPHLETYRERIAIQSDPVDESDWLRAFQEVHPFVEAMENGTATGYSLGRPSLFEVIWAMGALHFARSEVDMAVVEVGVGGRLSATNVLEPEVAVVTNVSLDHTALLGPTEESIALEKSQIIKTGSHAITAATQPPVLDVIRRRCDDAHSPLWVVGADVVPRVRMCDLQGEVVDISTPVADHASLKVPLLGRHQVLNAATAVAASDAVGGRGVCVPAEAVRAGLKAAALPGRFEIIRREPLVILDGARNGASARVLRNTLDELFPDSDIVLMMGVLKDKDAEAIVDPLGLRSHCAVVTNPPWEGRQGDPERLMAALGRVVPEVSYISSVPEALEVGLSKVRDGGLLLVTGSLYLVAAVRKLLVGSDRPGRIDSLTVPASSRAG